MSDERPMKDPSTARGGIAHAAWAVVGGAACVLLVLTGREGHPPAVILLPLVLLAWAAGHGLIWGAGRLAAAGRRRGAEATGGRAWPPGLQVAIVCTAAAAVVGLVQVTGTVLTGHWYPFGHPVEWSVMLFVWLVHAVCFVALIMRRRWSRLLGAALAFAWAALLGAQVAEHALRAGPSDTTGMIFALALMVLFALFGSYLLSSDRIRTFLGD